MKIKVIKVYVLVFIFIITAQMSFAKTGVMLNILRMKPTQKGIVITGKFTAYGLNTPIPEQDSVDVRIEIRKSFRSKYPVLATYYNMRNGCEANRRGCLSKVEKNGYLIDTVDLGSIVIRPPTVWMRYGLANWKKRAPDKVTSTFKGIVPLKYAGKKARFHLILKHVIGGPNAPWPGITYYHFVKFITLPFATTANGGSTGYSGGTSSGSNGGSYQGKDLNKLKCRGRGSIWFACNTDRPGADYKRFEMSRADARLCKRACDREKICNAWTYVKPGIQAKNPVCWLKQSVPVPIKNKNCCISGVKNIVALAPGLFRIKEPWGRTFRVTMCAPGFIGSSQQRFGWKNSGLSIGNISPPTGAHGGVLWLHPISLVEPAVVVGSLRVRSPDEALKIRIAGERRGDFKLVVLINNRAAYSGTINGQKWRWITIPLGKYYGRSVNIKLVCKATGWYYEYIFIDDIRFANYTTQKPPRKNYRYIGCFRDQGDPTGTSGRDLNGYAFHSPKMTPQMCINTCLQRGYRYAGVQYSSWCFCGNSYGRFGRATNCNMGCAGNKRVICGGVWANSVYKIR